MMTGCTKRYKVLSVENLDPKVSGLVPDCSYTSALDVPECSTSKPFRQLY